MSRKSTEILATAADTFSTLQQLLDASKDSLTPAERRRLKALVREDTKKSRELLNGKKLRTTPEGEHDDEEEACVVRLHEVLDHLEDEVTEEYELPREATAGA